MQWRFTGTPPNYWLAFLLAPLAGALTSLVIAVVMSMATSRTEHSLIEHIVMSEVVGLYALIIGAAFTAVVGAIVVLYVRLRRRVPSLAVAIVGGLLIAVIPFAIHPLALRIRSTHPPDGNSFLLTAFAAAAAIPTAWCFWWLGLRGRRVEG
jgi:hypothetical protein